MRRVQRFGVVLVVLGLVTGGCARAGTGSAATYEAADQQQSGTCDGVARPAALSLIPRDAVITDVAICGPPVEEYVPGEGSFSFTVVRVLPAAAYPELLAGLTLPDATGTQDTCTASLIVVGDFTVTLADGSRIRPGVPGDGCHPRNDALTAFEGLSAMPIRSRQRGEQARTELEVTTGCESDGKSAQMWVDAATGAQHAPLPTAPRGAVSVCRYRNTVDEQGPLVAGGLPDRAGLVAAWPTTSRISTTTCAPPADQAAAPGVDWITVRQAPKPPYRLDGTGSAVLALVELSGCRRLVTPQDGVIGSLDQAGVDALAALADIPAR